MALVLSVQAESGRAVPLLSVLRPVTEDEGSDSLLRVSFPQILLRAITVFLRNVLLLREMKVQKWISCTWFR